MRLQTRKEKIKTMNKTELDYMVRAIKRIWEKLYTLEMMIHSINKRLDALDREAHFKNNQEIEKTLD